MRRYDPKRRVWFVHPRHVWRPWSVLFTVWPPGRVRWQRTCTGCERVEHRWRPATGLVPATVPDGEIPF